MRVAVTGANGFVGTALMPSLGAAGLAPIAVGREQVGDIGPDTDWKPSLDGVDAVVHLAALVHVMHAATPEDSARFNVVNAEGTEKLARDAARSGVRRLVFLSTSKVMGDRDHGRPLAETDEPMPRDAYARSKLAAEDCLRAVAEETALEFVIIRPPLVYGPGAKGNFLSLLRLCDSPWPLPLKSIENKRSLVSLTNLCDAICRCVIEPAASGLSAFVTDGVDISTPELVETLRSGMGRSAHLLPFPTRALAIGLNLVRRGAMAERLLGSFSVDGAALRETVAWTPPQLQRTALRETAASFAGRRRNV